MQEPLYQFKPYESTHTLHTTHPCFHRWSGTSQCLSSSSSSSSCCCVLHHSISFDSISPWGRTQAFLQSVSLALSSSVSPPFFEKKKRWARIKRQHKEGKLHPSWCYVSESKQGENVMHCCGLCIITASLQKSHARQTHFSVRLLCILCMVLHGLVSLRPLFSVHLFLMYIAPLPCMTHADSQRYFCMLQMN